MAGAEAVGEMIDALPLHRQLLAQGCARAVDLPIVSIDGDTAIATCHGHLFRRNGDTFELWRATAVRWTFRRTDTGWRISSRVNRLLDGTDPPHDHFRDAIVEHSRTSRRTAVPSAG